MFVLVVIETLLAGLVSQDAVYLGDGDPITLLILSLQGYKVLSYFIFAKFRIKEGANGVNS